MNKQKRKNEKRTKKGNTTNCEIKRTEKRN
jgi:hypothetical protein